MTPKSAPAEESGFSITACRSPVGPGITTACPRARLTCELFDADQLDIEYQGRPRGNDALRAGIAVSQIGRNYQSPAAPHLHARHPLVAPLDDGAGAYGKLERFAALARAVELLTLVVLRGGLVQPAGVLHHRHLARRDGGAVTDLEIDTLQRSHRAPRPRRRLLSPAAAQGKQTGSETDIAQPCMGHGGI